MQNAQTAVLETVGELLMENEIGKALDVLSDLDKQSGADIMQDVIQQSGRYRSVSKRFNQGIVSLSDFTLEESKIRYALTELMGDIPKKIARNAKIRSIGAYNFEVPDGERFEKMIGKTSNLMTMDWFDKARKAANAVCRVVCSDGSTGTGSLTKEGYIFTNNHVIGSAEAAKTARIEFNFQEGKPVTSYQIDPSDFKTSPKTELDFARLKVIDRADAPLNQWGFVEFETETFPLVGEKVTIFSHPLGKAKQFDMDEVLGQLDHHIFYTTETEPGSSGSAVLNKDCKVIALHHKGSLIEEGGGFVINEKGEKASANRGILFRDIFAFIGK